MIFAGVFIRRPDDYPSTAASDLINALAGALSRRAEDEPWIYRHESACIAAFDLGALGCPMIRVDADGAVSVVAGEPILDRGSSEIDRTDLDRLHDAWLRDDWSTLRSANGVFNAVHFHPARGVLTLLTDKLGIRPLYVWEGDHIVVFATALRILEAVPQVRKVMDARGVSEMTAFGYPLADRTPYHGIRTLLPAELQSFSRDAAGRTVYWRWDSIGAADRPESEHLAVVHNRFLAAVERRLHGDRRVAAYLSGGLDSRTLVGGLQLLGVDVYSFNFSHPRSQDQAFGAAVAEVAGTIHHEIARHPNDDTDWSAMMASALERRIRHSDCPIDRPHVAWSGDGGTVIAGHVNVSPGILSSMRRGDSELAITAYLKAKTIGIKGRILQPDFRTSAAEIPRVGIREQLDTIECEDPGRQFYLFLLFNNQRRHLARHFERLDLHRIEFQLPFFDSGFVAAIMSVPLDLCLRHVFYHKWLAMFLPGLASVPWQTYPGHEPCPIPAPENLTYQWANEEPREFKLSRRRRLLREGREVLRASSFPSSLLDRNSVRQAYWAYRLRLRECGYLLDAANRYYRYWRTANGESTFTLTRPSKGVPLQSPDDVASTPIALGKD
jgi:asparagine synthase (glutamine-hydrolysing)